MRVLSATCPKLFLPLLGIRVLIIMNLNVIAINNGLIHKDIRMKTKRDLHVKKATLSKKKKSTQKFVEKILENGKITGKVGEFCWAEKVGTLSIVVWHQA